MAQDVEQARFFYGTACDHGDDKGCYNLGTLYENGKGIPEDLDHAVDLYQKSCKLGFQHACEEAARLGGQ